MSINHNLNIQTYTFEELLALFNGADIGGIGLMAFNKMADQSSRLFETGQIPFGGKQIIFTMYSA